MQKHPVKFSQTERAAVVKRIDSLLLYTGRAITEPPDE